MMKDHKLTVVNNPSPLLGYCPNIIDAHVLRTDYMSTLHLLWV